MTRHRQLFVTRADGTTFHAHTERDDAAGRKALERMAFEFMDMPNVVACEVTEPLDRIAADRRTYR